MTRSSSIRSRRRRVLLPLLVIVLLLIFIQVGRTAVILRRLQDDLRAAQGLSELSVLLLTDDPAAGIESLAGQATQDLRDLRGTLGPMVYAVPLMGWLPRYGGDLANAPALFDLAEQTLQSAQETLAIGRAINSEMELGRNVQVPVGVAILRASQSQAKLIQQARNHVASVSQVRRRIDSARLSPSLREMVNRFDRWFPLWQIGLDYLADAPKLLGAQQPRVYLLIAQNNDELRATGGFISAVAQVKVDQGKIAVTEFQDSFAVDDLGKKHPPPPDPLMRYMYAGIWVFRDANWSPDFPTAAQHMQDLYQLDRGVAADGVIAVNQTVIPRLLDAVGPVTLKEYNERVDSANVIPMIQSYWTSSQNQGQPVDWWEHRKDFMGVLLQTVFQRLISSDFDRPKLARVLSDAVTTRDLLVYINDLDSPGQNDSPLNGALFSGPGDALMVVDSNVGFNKVDVNVDREIRYTVDFDTLRAVRASVTITYTNRSPDNKTFCIHLPIYLAGYADLTQGCYWDYVRVLAPSGSKLIRGRGFTDAAQESAEPGRAAFGGYFVLPRGDFRVLNLEYRLPAMTHSESRYTLEWDKQPGAPSIPVVVQVNLPAGGTVTSTYPRPSRVTERTLEFALLLDRDQRIELAFEESLSVAAVVAFGVILAAFIVGVVLLRRRRSPIKS